MLQMYMYMYMHCTIGMPQAVEAVVGWFCIAEAGWDTKLMGAGQITIFATDES